MIIVGISVAAVLALFIRNQRNQRAEAQEFAYEGYNIYNKLDQFYLVNYLMTAFYGVVIGISCTHIYADLFQIILVQFLIIYCGEKSYQNIRMP